MGKQSFNNRNYTTSTSSDSGETELTDDSGSDLSINRRRVTRSSNIKRPRNLPFSPRKTRSSWRVVEDSESSKETSVDSSDNIRRNNYRSTRNNRTIIESELSDAESDDNQIRELHVSKSKRKRLNRVSAIKAGYGLIHNIVDVLEMELEISPLLAHRSQCEQCHREPAHILLERSRKRKGKRKAKDANNGFSDEEQSPELLGGGGYAGMHLLLFPYTFGK